MGDKCEARTADIQPQACTTSDEAKKRTVSRLSVASGLFISAVTIVAPKRAPMVLTIKRGDAAATARLMGLMSASAAALELVINPVFGRLADKYGRKPFLLLAPAMISASHLAVGLFPTSLVMAFADRTISGAMILSFVLAQNAALSDLFSGQELVLALCQNGTALGVGSALGPLLGARMSGARAFKASAAMCIATCVWTWTNFSETLRRENVKEFSIVACSPLRFVELFRGKVMSSLAGIVGLQSCGDYINFLDVSFLNLKSNLGYGPSELSNFATAIGVSQIVGGKAMEILLKVAGQRSATFVSNTMWMVAMALLGSARSTLQLGLALVALTFGHQRGTAVGAQLMKHGQAAGMGGAEVAAAKANLMAVLKVFVPALYGNLYAWGTSRKRPIPGLPFYGIAMLTGLAQLIFWTVDANKATALPNKCDGAGAA